MADGEDHDWTDLLKDLDPEEQRQLHDLIEQQRLIKSETEVGWIGHNKWNDCVDCFLFGTTAWTTPQQKSYNFNYLSEKLIMNITIYPLAHFPHDLPLYTGFMVMGQIFSTEV